MIKRKKIQYYIGMDVHKKFTAYNVSSLYGRIISEGECSSDPKYLYEILNPYLFSCVIAVETNTEIYPIYDFFKEKCIDIRVANTLKLRSIVGKNDPIDAKRLADMLRLNTLPCSYIPESDIRELRGLVQTRHSLLETTTKLKNQIKSICIKHGVHQNSKRENLSRRYLLKLLDYLVSKKILELRYPVESLLYFDTKKDQVTTELTSTAKNKFPREFEAISSHTGIGEVLTSYLISEICPVSRFESVKKLRRYAGVIPVTDQSGGKLYSTYLPKCASRSLLRWALVQAAHCMSKHNDNIKAYYKKKKKEKKITNKAIMATASSISDIIYKSLKSCS